MNYFELLIKKLEVLQLEVNIIGDLNCDVSASSLNCHTKRLLDLCNLYQYQQVIHETTRITQTTSSTIDLFITNNPTLYKGSGVCHIGISDHSLIYGIRKLCVPKSCPRIITSRQFRNFDADAFRYDLSLASWHIIQRAGDPNVAWNAWKAIFLKISDIHAPKRRRKIRNKHSPWLTSDIKKLIFERDKLKRIASKYKSDENWSKYKTARNNVNRCIKSAKIAYYQNYFRDNKGDIKNVWKGVNEIMGRNPPKSEIHNIRIGDLNYSTASEIGNVINDHFSNIGPKLINEVPNSNSSHRDYITPTELCFSLKETNITVVNNWIQSLPLNKATGLDEISCRLLKEASQIITPSLTFIINLSIRTGIFPSDWKVARVMPVYKEGAKSDPDNYRPISILPIVSKIIEKIVFGQFYDYLLVNDLLAHSQHGFRPQHSTLTTLLLSTNNWYQNIDEGLLSGVLFLDLKKAFDTVDHKILLEKLVMYGVDSNSIKWFRSYLTDRQQCTCINDTMSGYLPVVSGVPQGSVLGPLLFLVFINDLQACLSASNMMMYADDTCLTATDHVPDKLEDKLNNDLMKVQTWLQANKLTLNVKKTKYLIIASQKRLSSLNYNFEVKIDGKVIERKYSYRYLGVEIDESLNWQVHVDDICKKVSACLGALKRSSRLVPCETLLMMYKALVLPYLDYCSEVWGCLGKTLSDKLQKLQNRASRIITFSDYDIRSADILQALGWDTLDKRRAKQLVLSVYKAINHFYPEELNLIFECCSQVHSYNLRGSSNNIFIPRPRTEAGKRAFSYRGAVLWNELPDNARNQPSIQAFKNSL